MLVLKGNFFLNVSSMIVKKEIPNNQKSHFSSFNIVQYKITNYSIIPLFHYSNCERSELSSSRKNSYPNVENRYSVPRLSTS